MDKDFENKNQEQRSSDDIYSDYPKDIVKLMMENHPLRKNSPDNKNDDTKTYSTTKSKITGQTEDTGKTADVSGKEPDVNKQSMDGIQSEYKLNTDILGEEQKNDAEKQPDETAEKADDSPAPNLADIEAEMDESVLKDEPSDIRDINPRKKNLKRHNEEEDDEQVQVVRHKERPKGFKRDFGADEPQEPKKTLAADAPTSFEEIKKRMADEKIERHKMMKNNGQKAGHMPHKTDVYNEMQYKRKKNKSSETLDLLKSPNDGKKIKQQEFTPAGKKLIIVCAVAVFVFLFLIVRTVTLTHKVSALNSQLTDYQDMKQKNEEYKLEILSLQDKLKDNATPSTTTDTTTGDTTGAAANANGTAAASGDATQSDTYTVVSGDTISGISQKVYGNYSGYKKILEANGLTESSNIQIGQTLKIPK